MIAMQPTVLTFPAVINYNILLSFFKNKTLTKLLQERNVFLKEQNMKLYKLSSYFIGKTVPELPVLFITPVCSLINLI
jgi:hypothetical protein